jgi:FKBP-type peptidyl-prolyl cis-trans isomerase
MKKSIILIVIISVLFTGCGPDLSTDEAAMSYMIAYDFIKSQGTEIKNIKMIIRAVNDFPEKNASYSNDAAYLACFKHLEELKNYKIIINKKNYLKGAEDSIKGKKSGIDPERTKIIRNKFNNIISSNITITTDEFHKRLRDDKRLKRTGTGLYYKIITQGDGPAPSNSSRVTVNMIGQLPNGFEFTNTYLKQTPVQFYLKATIKGMAEGLSLMKTGSRYIFYIPPALGYGSKSKGVIPADSYIIYEIELLRVE